MKQIELPFLQDSFFARIHHLKRRLFSIEGLVASIIIANFVLYLCILLYSHHNFFPVNAADKGIMYQMYYTTVHYGDFFYSSILGGSGLAYRYILITFLPFMYLFPEIPITFSIISTALICLGALPVYWLAAEVARSRHIGLLFVGLYFLFPSVGWLMLESVKEEIYVLPFLLFAFYFMYTRAYSKSMFFLFLVIICKQNMFLILPMFAVYAYLENYDKKWIAGPLAITAGWFLTVQYVLKPYFYAPANASSLSGFSYITVQRYEWMGSTIREVLTNLVTNPLLFIQHLITIDNGTYLLLLFIPLCGISLLKPKVLLIGLPIFLQNLLTTHQPMKEILWHYVSVPVFVILVAAILAFPIIYDKLNNSNKKKFILTLIIVATSIFLVYGPITETAINIHNLQSYEGRIDPSHSYLALSVEHRDIMHTILNEIPYDADVFVNHNFGPYLYTIKNLTYSDFHENYDYYFLDKRQINTFHDFYTFNQIINRPDIYLHYYDGRYIVTGIGDELPVMQMKDINTLDLVGFRHNPEISQSVYDTEINETVFFSSKKAGIKEYFLFGPYIRMPAAEYTILFDIKADNITCPEQKVAIVDVFSTYTDNSDLIHVTEARRDVYAKDLDEGNYTPISIEFAYEKEKHNRVSEFRVFQNQNSDLYVRDVRIIITG